MRRTKYQLLCSAVALLLCFSMLLGTTFAWFSDSVSSTGNMIKTGKLETEMYYSDSLLSADSTEWKNAEGVAIFAHDSGCLGR